MKHFSLRSLSAGLVMAAMSGPLALAQQGQYQPSPSQHGSKSGQYGAPPQHMGAGPEAPAHAGQQTPPGQHNNGMSMHNESQGAPSQHMGTGPGTPEHEGPQAPPGQYHNNQYHNDQYYNGQYHNDMDNHEESPGEPGHGPYSSGHQWHHGDYYHGNRYVVGDWQHYRLRQPPYGYEWVQDGDQFVLIAIATGIITDVILNAMNQ